MKNQTSLELDLKTEVFISRAQNLLKKIGTIGNEVVGKNQKKFKDTIMEIRKQKKSPKQIEQTPVTELLEQIEMINQQIEQQRNYIKSLREEIKERASVFQMQSKKMIEELKIERVQTEKRLKLYLESEVNNLKAKNSRNKINPQTNDWKDGVSSIKKEMKHFFESAEIQQNEINQRISSFIQECHQLLRSIQSEDPSASVLEHMRQIQNDISKQIKNLALQRLTMEEGVLNLFETISSHRIK